MCTYLAKRGSTYYFRRAIPAELRPAFGGRAEFMLSLRTKDRDEAKRRIPAHTIETDRALAAARRMPPSAPEKPAQPHNAAAAAAEWAMQERSLEADEIAASELAEQEARQEAREDERRYWRSRMRFTTRDLTPHEAAVKDLLSDKEFDLGLARDRIAYLTAALRDAKAAGDPDALARPAKTLSAAPADAPGQDTGTMLDTVIVPRWA
ncbi:DUF6538 domain-containing protein, partial [Sphingomonas sp.]|uniref:DUF6538 domain-containing protein n=1 Tax=Sphingomonas sp. TaxID=28214 RepID=UPI002D1A7438